MKSPLSPDALMRVKALTAVLEDVGAERVFPVLADIVTAVFNDGLRAGRDELLRDQLAAALETAELRKQYPGLPAPSQEVRNGS